MEANAERLPELPQGRVYAVVVAHDINKVCTESRPLRDRVHAGLAIERETAKAMEANADRLLELPQGRVRMEADALFGYGAAAASLQLLWRYRLLDVLLPQLAERFKQAKVPRCGHFPQRYRYMQQQMA